MITKVMGVLLFFTGLGGILIGTSGMLGIINALNGAGEVFLMIGGSVLCVLGFFMARDHPVTASEEEKPES